MNRTEYIQQRAAIDEAARKIALDLIREQFPDVEWTPSGQCKLWQNGTLARLHPAWSGVARKWRRVIRETLVKSLSSVTHPLSFPAMGMTESAAHGKAILARSRPASKRGLSDIFDRKFRWASMAGCRDHSVCYNLLKIERVRMEGECK